MSLRIQQIETTLSILEAKVTQLKCHLVQQLKNDLLKISFVNLQLASIPGLEDVTVDGLRPSAQTNGPTVDGSHPSGSSTVPPPEVSACYHINTFIY